MQPIPFKGTVSLGELAQRLHEICDGIERQGDVWKVCADRKGQQFVFVLAPPSIGGYVCGLYDAEYGWPADVPIDEGCEPGILMPGTRRHPFLTRAGRCVAVALDLGEYEDIIKKNAL